MRRLAALGVGVALAIGSRFVRADEPEPLPPLPAPSAPPPAVTPPAVTPPPVTPPEATAPPPPPEAPADAPPKPKVASAVLPDLYAGYARERVLGLDVDRADLGLGLRMREPPKPYGLSFALHVSPGRTTWGLTSFRNDLAFGVYYGDVVRASAHLHANYTMMLRATGHDSFARALFGDIAALGFGPDAELALGPFPGWPRGFLAMRGGVDAFLPGGTAVFAGLALGFQVLD